MSLKTGGANFSPSNIQASAAQAK